MISWEDKNSLLGKYMKEDLNSKNKITVFFAILEGEDSYSDTPCRTKEVLNDVRKQVKVGFLWNHCTDD